MVACIYCGFTPITSSMNYCPNCSAPADRSFNHASHQIATNTAEHVLHNEDPLPPPNRGPPAKQYNPEGVERAYAYKKYMSSKGGRRTKRTQSLKRRSSKRNRTSKRRRPKGTRKKGNASKRNKKRTLKRGGGACQSGMCPLWIDDIKEKMRKKYQDFDEDNLDQIIKDNKKPEANLLKFIMPTTQENMFREAMSQEPSYLLFKENMYQRKNQISPFDDTDTHGPAQHDTIYYTPTPDYTPY